MPSPWSKASSLSKACSLTMLSLLLQCVVHQGKNHHVWENWETSAIARCNSGGGGGGGNNFDMAISPRKVADSPSIMSS